MPISDLGNMKPILDEVYRLQPDRVMELGVGFGKYGVLCREVLDAMYGRCRPDQWQRKIEGYEAHEPYRNPAWNLYDAVHIGDFTAADISGWPLVLMVDSLEHLGPEQGSAFLSSLVERNQQVIVSVPSGVCPQGEMYGNEYEAHRTTYTGREFDRYRSSVLHRGFCIAVSIKGKG